MSKLHKVFSPHSLSRTFSLPQLELESACHLTPVSDPKTGGYCVKGCLANMFLHSLDSTSLCPARVFYINVDCISQIQYISSLIILLEGFKLQATFNPVTQVFFYRAAILSHTLADGSAAYCGGSVSYPRPHFGSKSQGSNHPTILNK